MNARLGALACALLATAAPASAAPITTLYSTGQGAAGSADPHYALAGAPGGYTTAYVVGQNAQFPFDAYWASNSFSPAAGAPASGWIAPTANVNTTHPDGYYTYRTTFDLTGFDPATARVTGFVAADNAVQVFLNTTPGPPAPPAGRGAPGVTTAFAPPGPDPAVSVYAPLGYTFTAGNFANQSFTLTGGFVPGQNTLTFVVYNEVQATGNPTGLRVALSGTADPLPAAAVPTPEPAAAAVFAGLLGVSAYIRRTARRPAGAAV